MGEGEEDGEKDKFDLMPIPQSEENTEILGTSSVRDDRDTAPTGLECRMLEFSSLRYPNDTEHPKLVDLLRSAQSFQMSFERESACLDQPKIGRLNVTFINEEEAQLMYERVKDLAFEDHTQINVRVPKAWMKSASSKSELNMIRTEAKVSPSEPENYKEVADIAERDEVVKQDDNATSGDVTAAESSEASAKDKNLSGEDFEPGECESPPPSSEIPDFVADDPEAPYKLYISNLLPSSDNDLMLAIFGKENLKKVNVFVDESRLDGSKIAVLTFVEKQKAEDARQDYDGFSIDDGDVSRPMRIIPFIKHLENIYYDARKRVEAERTKNAGSLWAAQLTAPTRAVEPVETLSYSNRNGRAIASTGPAGLEPGELDDSDVVAPIVAERVWSPAEIQREIMWLLQQSGVKFEDFQGATDIWVLLDQVAVRNGNAISEKDLAKAMMSVLEREKFKPIAAGWRRDHITLLHTEWRRETQGLDNPNWKRHSRPTISLKKNSDKPEANAYETPTAESELSNGPTKWEDMNVVVIPSGPDNYTPVPLSPKRRPKRDRKDVVALMGVGSLLSGLSAEALEDPAQKPTEEFRSQRSDGKTKLLSAESVKYRPHSRENKEVRSGPHPSGYGYEPGDFDGHDATGHRVTVRENRAKRRRRKRSRSSGSSDGSSSSEERRRRNDRRKRREHQGAAEMESLPSQNQPTQHGPPQAAAASNPLMNLMSLMPNLMNIMPLLGMMGGGGGLPQIMLVVQQMQRMLAMMPPGQQQQLMQQMATQLQSMMQVQNQPQPQGPPPGNPVMLQMQQILQQVQTQLGGAGQPGLAPTAQPQPASQMLQIQQLMSQMAQMQQNSVQSGPLQQQQQQPGGHRMYSNLGGPYGAPL